MSLVNFLTIATLQVVGALFFVFEPSRVIRWLSFAVGTCGYVSSCMYFSSHNYQISMLRDEAHNFDNWAAYVSILFLLSPIASAAQNKSITTLRGFVRAFATALGVVVVGLLVQDHQMWKPLARSACLLAVTIAISYKIAKYVVSKDFKFGSQSNKPKVKTKKLRYFLYVMLVITTVWGAANILNNGWTGLVSRPQKAKPQAQKPAVQLPDAELTAQKQSLDSDLQDVINEVSTIEGLNDWTQVPDLFNTNPVPKFMYFGKEQWVGKRNYETHVVCLRMPEDSSQHVRYRVEVNPSEKPIELVLSRNMRYENFDVDVAVNAGAKLYNVRSSSEPAKVHIVGATDVATERNYDYIAKCDSFYAHGMTIEESYLYNETRELRAVAELSSDDVLTVPVYKNYAFVAKAQAVAEGNKAKQREKAAEISGLLANLSDRKLIGGVSIGNQTAMAFPIRRYIASVEDNKEAMLSADFVPTSQEYNKADEETVQGIYSPSAKGFFIRANSKLLNKTEFSFLPEASYVPEPIPIKLALSDKSRVLAYNAAQSTLVIFDPTDAAHGCLLMQSKTGSGRSVPCPSENPILIYLESEKSLFLVSNNELSRLDDNLKIVSQIPYSFGSSNLDRGLQLSGLTGVGKRQNKTQILAQLTEDRHVVAIDPNSGQIVPLP